MNNHPEMVTWRPRCVHSCDLSPLHYYSLIYKRNNGDKGVVGKLTLEGQAVIMGFPLSTTSLLMTLTLGS